MSKVTKACRALSFMLALIYTSAAPLNAERINNTHSDEKVKPSLGDIDNSLKQLLEYRESELRTCLIELNALYQSGLVSKVELAAQAEKLNVLRRLAKLTGNNVVALEEELINSVKQRLSAVKNQLISARKLAAMDLIAEQELRSLETEAAFYRLLSKRLSIIEEIMNSSSIEKIEPPSMFGSAPYKVSSRFGYREDPVHSEGRTFHRGVDFGVAYGSDLYAPVSGLIEAVGESEFGGRYIEMAHAGGFITRYYHLSEISVQEGDILERGQQIGKTGNSGSRCTGPHLHFEILEDNIPVNPMKFF